MECYGVLWSAMEYYGVLWSAMEYYGVLWSSLEWSGVECSGVDVLKVISQLVNRIFFMDCLNFSFWSDNPRPYTVAFNGKTYTGFWSLCAALNRALEEGIPLLDHEYCATRLDFETFARAFRSETEEEMPFLRERWELVKSNAKVVHEVREQSSNVLSGFASFLWLRIRNLAGASTTPLSRPGRAAPGLLRSCWSTFLPSGTRPSSRVAG